MRDAAAEPLRGLKVLELSRDAPAAYCGRQFAQWGAEVVVVEPPEGSALRRMGPMASQGAAGDRSLVWAYVAAGKRSAIRPEGGLAALDGLLAAADVFILDHEADPEALVGLRARHPRLCIVGFTSFGLTGAGADWPGGDLVVQALSGYMAPNGLPDRPPLRAPAHILPYAVGVNGFVGALASLIKRERTGWGEAIEVSALETLACLTPSLFPQYLGADRVREGGVQPGMRIFRCQDGWVSMYAAVDGARREEIRQVLDVPLDAWPTELPEDYVARVAKVHAFLSGYTVRKTADEIFYGLERLGIGCGRLIRPGELAANAQLQARDFFRTLEHPELGPLPFAGPAGQFRHGRPAKPSPAPRMDQRIRLEAVGWRAEGEAPEPTGPRDEAPLAGLKLLDLTQAWIGPFATLLMADLGAEVVKVESHRRPDVWRQSSPMPVPVTDLNARAVNRSAYFNSVNRNKKNLTLDLATAEGKAIFLALVKDADVVIENFTSGVMGRFGLDYDALAKVKSDLVMLSSSGFGKTGPWKDYKTNGSAIETLAGWDAMHAYPDDGEPVLMGFYQADAICGFQMAAMTLVAVMQRLRTGRGEAIDASMFEAASGYVGEAIFDAALNGEAAAMGNRSLDMAPHGVFPCQGEDRWIAIAAADDAAWRALRGMPGVPERLQAAAFETLEGRLADQDGLEAALADWTVGWRAEDLMAALQARGVAAGVVRRMSEGFASPHLGARDWYIPMILPDLGEHLYYGFAWRFSDCALCAHTPAPRLGEHSRALLRERLGYDEAAIEALFAKGVTGEVF